MPRPGSVHSWEAGSSCCKLRTLPQGLAGPDGRLRGKSGELEHQITRLGPGSSAGLHSSKARQAFHRTSRPGTPQCGPQGPDPAAAARSGNFLEPYGLRDRKLRTTSLASGLAGCDGHKAPLRDEPVRSPWEVQELSLLGTMYLVVHLVGGDPSS
ncbi:unnamed protein product [Durusdinium trenchii]|uniref:Uncharacterized protein n=1 Tax=Durusdinium trenchii TaxID=1381693 RepID=A0ABP0SGX0_9DINO